MDNQKNTGLKRLWFVFYLNLAAMLFAGLYPFDFFPKNRVQWLSGEPGLYFNGSAIAYTDKKRPFLLKNTLSIQILIKERYGSKNWGPKEILSFYDGSSSPPLLVGQWDRRIFLYSRFEKSENKQWYQVFRTENRFPRGENHLVTVTFDENEKAIYIDGQPGVMKKVAPNDKARITFSGRLLIGGSPRGKNGWKGEIKGIAIYDRILRADEIVRHSREILKNGMGVLDKTADCLAVYPFDEGKGISVKNILNDTGHFCIPANLNSLALSSVDMSFKEMRLYGFSRSDFLMNIAFFIPFGFFFSIIIRKRYAAGLFAAFLVVILAGGLLSSAIEWLQLLLPHRSSDMADIFGNALGSGLGALITSILLKTKKTHGFLI